MAGILGLSIVKDEANDTVTLSQQGLIERILRATNLEDYNPSSTPVD